jgi:hypothetical protein
MKKIALWMVLALLVFSFTACAEKAQNALNTSGTEENATIQIQNADEEETEETSEETTERTTEATAEATTEATGEHKFVQQTVREATCTEEGFALFTCTICGESYTEQLPAYGHDYSSASCVDPSMCGTCGEIIEDPLGHVDENGLCKNCGMDLSGGLGAVDDGL